MSISSIRGKNVDVKMWAPLHEVESAALDQLRNVASLPNVFHHVAVMPDVHFGKGATVGSVVAMKGAVCPAAVGVDIGCGMAAVPLNMKRELMGNLSELRSALEATIPVGFNSHDHLSVDMRLKAEVNALFSEYSGLAFEVQDIEGNARKQVGTLGGGNHFIELQVDKDDYVWLMLHSGSRNIGKTLAEIHISIAKELMHGQKIADPELAYFLAGTKEMMAYRRDLFWAQRYAFLNRKVMLELCGRVLTQHLGLGVEFHPDQMVNCHHNYVAEEYHFGQEVLVTRKGAISARKGELGIIPGSMGSKSYIVRGLGNPESFHSASHGAGRRMSRGAAKRKFTIDDLVEQTEGVECRKDAGIIDEIRGAYKDIEQVMANQQDLVEIVQELSPILCVKG